MAHFATAIIAALAFVAVGVGSTSARADGTGVSKLNPCSVPNEVSNSFEETAWRIWVAATCPVNADQYPFVVWENWIEQSQLYPSDPSQGLKVPNSGALTVTYPLHGSPLALALHPSLALGVGLPGGPNTNCNKAGAPPANQPNLVICEEVRENGATEDYTAGTGLWDRLNQQQAAAVMDDIQFPRPAVEIKADWICCRALAVAATTRRPGFMSRM